MATVEDTASEIGGGGAVESLKTAYLLGRVWFIVLFSAAMVVFSQLEGTAAPPGYLYFWGVFTVIAGVYALRRTQTILED